MLDNRKRAACLLVDAERLTVRKRLSPLRQGAYAHPVEASRESTEGLVGTQRVVVHYKDASPIGAVQ